MKTKSNPAPASNGTHYDEYLDQPLAKGWRKMGDFYEYSSTWGGGGSFKPSEIAKTLNLAVTRRGMDAMVGFPYHMAHKCVEALKAAGQWETSPAASSVPAPAETMGAFHGVLISPDGVEHLCQYDAPGLTQNPAEAIEYTTESAAMHGCLHRLGRGEAFWSSERSSREATAKRMSGWKYEVRPIAPASPSWLPAPVGVSGQSLKS